MEPEVLVFGSAIVDFICYVDRLPKAGETLHGSRFATGFGGKGSNQCVAAAKLGTRTAMIAKVGGDTWGHKYLENFKSQGVDTQAVQIVETATTGVAQINVANSGENQIVIVAGANNLLLEEDVHTYEKLFKGAKALICQLETPISGTLEALKTFKGTSILNAAPAVENIPVDLLIHSKIFCVNEHEASIMSGVHVESVADAKKAITKFHSMGANIVIITMGELGVVYGENSTSPFVHIPVPTKVEKVLDTTGAGDAFTGALAYFLVKYPTNSMINCIGAACEIAAHSVQRLGTQSSFPTSKDVDVQSLATKTYEFNKV